LECEVEISDEAIFDDVTATIAAAMQRCHARSSAPTLIASTAFAHTLEQLV
jgi:glutamate dehydrogenase (NAD(P)+)